MKITELQTLICTHGRDSSRPSLVYGAQLARLFNIPAVLLGIQETGGASSTAVDALLAEGEAELQKLDVPYRIERKTGRIEEIVASEAETHPSLTVIPPLERSVLHEWLMGDPLQKLFARINQPIFHVPTVNFPIRRILCSVGGLAYATSVAHFCIRLAKISGAELTFLYVVEPANLDESLLYPAKEHERTLVDTDTPQGRNLRRMREEALEAGVKAQIHLRRGIPLREILTQIREDEYDLIGLGSSHSANTMRQRYLPNITAEVTESTGCPVVTVRYGFELDD